MLTYSRVLFQKTLCKLPKHLCRLHNAILFQKVDLHKHLHKNCSKKFLRKLHNSCVSYAKAIIYVSEFWLRIGISNACMTSFAGLLA